MDEAEASLEPAQVTGVTDVDPQTLRRMLHEVADVMADYAEGLEARPVLPPVEPGSIAPLFPAARAGRPGVAGDDPRRRPTPGRPQRHALAAPGVHGLLRDVGVGARGCSASS